jgi:hypothetical protein
MEADRCGRAPGQRHGALASTCAVAAAHSTAPAAPLPSPEFPTGFVARITGISSLSKKSFDDAIAQGIVRANKTL